MTAGLPGSGIGGLFYLLTALLMPLHELGMALKGASSPQRRRVVAFQSTIALGIVLMVWATGWALGWLIQAAGQPAFAGNGLPGGGNFLRLTPFAVILTTLGGVMVGVQILRLAVHGRSPVQRAKVLNSGPEDQPEQ
ncbi:MAG: hypothetical protein ACT4O3_09320 [Elusimicrobiota bacterium]